MVGFDDDDGLAAGVGGQLAPGAPVRIRHHLVVNDPVVVHHSAVGLLERMRLEVNHDSRVDSFSVGVKVVAGSLLIDRLALLLGLLLVLLQHGELVLQPLVEFLGLLFDDDGRLLLLRHLRITINFTFGVGGVLVLLLLEPHLAQLRPFFRYVHFAHRHGVGLLLGYTTRSGGWLVLFL